MLPVEELERGLAQCCGTTRYFRHWMGKNYTEGVQFLAEAASCYWLLDAIFSYRRKEVFQVWTLKKTKGNSAVLTMKTSSKRPALVKQEISYTDFPLDEITLWIENGVLILPNEH